ncbi:tetratricopeptide repeat protein [Alkalimonas mucilaginosa]|uniref:Tetratricopeptide repeat protein n=1 Tax=Alkalimonas mucilaginosa TaxID=3057676 RepID=A0ABU7JET9_9GAMM|nr:tetratricopeptide repeat protein [Alkalimonas sp. MEB004]MEE2024209.1 tetratricopeptide repeat protein [Alkalimonas sp. MEB004]
MKDIRQLFLLISMGLWSLSLQASQAVPLGAPAWLQQVIEQKRIQPETMLVLLQQHEDQIPTLPLQIQRSAYLQFASIYGMLGEHQQQLNYARKGLALDDRIDAVRIQLMFNLGFATEIQDNYLQAQQYYQQGTQLAEQLGLASLRFKGLMNQAAILRAQDHYQEALSLLQQVYQQSSELDDPEIEAEIHAELGLLYATVFEDEAVAFLEQAYGMFKAMGWRTSKIAVLYNLAQTYSALEQYEQAFSTYQRILTVSQQYDDQLNLYYAYLGLAITSYETGRFNSALTYIQKAEEFMQQLQSPMRHVMHFYEKATIYSGLEQYSQALQQLLLSEQLLQELDHVESAVMLLNIQFMQAEVRASLGQYEQAYALLQDFLSLFRERFTQESQAALNSLRLNFEYEREQSERALLLKDNELQALRLQEAERKRLIQWLWTAVFAITSLVLMILLLWQRKLRHSAETLQSHHQEETKSL